MKKLLSIFVLIACLCAWTGCEGADAGKGQSGGRDSSRTTLRSVASTTLGAEATDPTTEPDESEEDAFLLPIGEGEAIEYLPDADQPQLKKITELTALGSPAGISCFGRFMIACFYESAEGGDVSEGGQAGEESTRVLVIDLLTGEITADYRYDSPVSVGFLENGKVYLTEYAPLSVKVFDRLGAVEFSYTSESCDQITVDPSGDGWAWLCKWDGRQIERVSLGDRSVTVYPLSQSEGYYIQAAVDGSAYLSSFSASGVSQMLRLTADGGCEPCQYPDGYYGIGDTLCCEASGRWSYTDLSVPNDRICYFGWEGSDKEDAYLLSADRGRFIVESCGYDEAGTLGEDRLILCQPAASARTEVLLGEQTLSGQCWSEDALYLLLNIGDAYALCLWDYQSAPSEPLAVGVFTLSELEKQNLSDAQALKDEWGISVYFGEEDMARTPSDYVAEPLGDQTLIADALGSLSDALGDYPKGFFLELPYGDYDHLEIYLCAGLTPADGKGIGNAIAISNTRGSALLIVLDVTAIRNLRQTLAHEILHMMEKRIDQVDPSLLADWTSLTPGGDDAYFFSYHDPSGNEMNDERNTWEGESDPEAVWFVDAYSKSYPTEDRARVFEYLVRDEGNPFYLDAPVLRTKAERLCEVIRLAFPSVANAEEVAWEIK